MKLITVSGIQNSGKTTLISNLMARLYNAGRRSAVIENENGQTTYDAGFLNRYPVGIERQRTVINHVQGADIVAVSRSDRLDIGRLEFIRKALASFDESQPVIELSIPLGQGVKEVIKKIG